MSHHLRMLLEGKVGAVIGNFRRLLNTGQVRGSQRNKVQAAITYYQNNRRHMHYDEYLAAGYPIGSGVAEGACRHGHRILFPGEIEDQPFQHVGGEAGSVAFAADVIF